MESAFDKLDPRLSSLAIETPENPDEDIPWLVEQRTKECHTDLGEVYGVSEGGTPLSKAQGALVYVQGEKKHEIIRNKQMTKTDTQDSLIEGDSA